MFHIQKHTYVHVYVYVCIYFFLENCVHTVLAFCKLAVSILLLFGNDP